MTESRDKIFAKDVLSSFEYFSLLRGENVAPLFVYDDRRINEFLYKWYKSHGEFFAEIFKPEENPDYPRFPHFYDSMQHVTKAIPASEDSPEIRKLDYLADYPFLELIRPSSKIILQIGEEFEYNFGCDIDGDFNLRTEMKTRPRGDKISLPINKFLR